MPYAENHGRVIAPDLIGMGDSEKLEDSGPDRYTFEEHAKYLYALFEKLELNNATLVIHDWGSALGFNWSRLNPEKVKALVYMEAITATINLVNFIINFFKSTVIIDLERKSMKKYCDLF